MLRLAALPVLLLLALLLAGCARSPAFAPPTPEAAAYRAELLALREADQAPRQRLVALLQRYDYQPPDSLYRPLARAVQHVDSVNLVALEGLLAARGWPRQSEVGPWAASAAYLVVQHAPLEAQLRHAPALRAAVEAGEAEPAWLATLTDRILVRQGQPQRYGTQTCTAADGTRAFCPIENEAGLEARRASVGLAPMAAYAREMGVPYPSPRR